MKIPRPLVFWLFVAGFFVTAGLVLMYTFGYRFSPERGVFVYTGSLTIDSNPQTAEIKIDGTTVPQNRLGILNSSAHVPGLAPGEYQIEVSAPGYHPWQKKVIIESGKSTEYWNVLLTKEDPAPATLPGTAEAIRAFASPQADLIALAKQHGNDLAVLTYETDTGLGEQVFSLPGAHLLGENQDGLEWSPQAEKLLIPVERAGFREYYLVDIETKQATLIPSITQDGRRKYPRFDPNDRATAIYLDNQTLYRLDTRATALVPQPVHSGILTYDISASQIYMLNSGGIISRFPLSNTPSTESVQITTSSVPADAANEYSLVVYDESRITILEPGSGHFWLYNRDMEPQLQSLRESGIRGTQFSDDGKKLLFWSDNEISVAFPRDWEVQPARVAGTTQQIARFTTPLHFVQWTKDYEHVLYALEGNIKIAEVDSRDRRNITDFLNLPQTPFQVFSRFEEDNVYVIKQGTENEDRLLQIAFPEAVTLFGFGN